MGCNIATIKVTAAIALVFDWACSQFCKQIEKDRVQRLGIRILKYLDAVFAILSL